MNIAKLFGYGFIPRKMLGARKEKWWKFLILYILMFFISVFPFTVAIIKEGGFKLDYTKDLNNYNEILPSEVKSISITGVLSDKDNIYHNINNTVFIFSYNKEFDKDYFKSDKNYFIFMKDRSKGIIYLSEMKYLKGSYKSFGTEVSFTDYNSSNIKKRKEIITLFDNQLRNSFKYQTVLFSLLTFILTQFSLYFALFLILAGLLQFFRYGYTYFMTYGQTLKMLVLSMIYPSIISFIIGFLHHAFMPVIFQFGVPIIISYTILAYGKNYFHGEMVEGAKPKPRKDDEIRLS